MIHYIYYDKDGIIDSISELSYQHDLLEELAVDVKDGESLYDLFGYRVVNGALQADDKLMNEVVHNRAMDKKAILIPAFGKYRADVVYGLIDEDETTKETLLDWYKRVQEDNIEAIECPPNIIEKYL